MNINTAVTTTALVRIPQNCASSGSTAEAIPAAPQQGEVFVKSQAAAAPEQAPAPAPKKSEPKPKPEFDPEETTPRRDGDDGPGLGGGYPPVLERVATRTPHLLSDGLFDADGPTLGGGYFGPPEAGASLLCSLPYDESEMLLFDC